MPPELAEFLKDRTFACVMHGTDNVGTVLVMKAPRREIESCRGRVPIHLIQEVYDHPAAPVIRTVVTIYDRPDQSLTFETFTNIADAIQSLEFAAIAEQDLLHLIFYDEALVHRLTKAIASPGTASITTVLRQAEGLRAAILPDRFDFDRAKADVMERTKL